ncbi:hypothetical protein P3G55_17175 [Leptospira sp. 96542]|nr:hypothetical protein [Leptospira sp. 96542]
MKFLIIVSFLISISNCTSSFYDYSIKKNNMDYNSEKETRHSVRKKILFLTDGYLDDLADLLEKRGHTVERMKISDQNMLLVNQYDTTIILKYNKLDVFNKIYFELPMILSLGIIPSYAKFSRNYSFVILQNNNSQEIQYSLSLKKFQGWAMFFVNLTRNDEKSLYFPNTELNMKLTPLIEKL